MVRLGKRGVVPEPYGASAAGTVGAAEHLGIRDMRVGFRTLEGFKPVLDVSELAIARGESYGLVGESAAGKTVLALAVLGLLQSPPAVVEAGRLDFLGRSMIEADKKTLRGLRGGEIAMIFQDPMSSLNPVFTVGQHLQTVIRQHASLDRAAAAARSREMLALVELPDADNMVTKYPHQLSGGQRQRVVIALALACGAQFLIADEPTRNLDVTIQAGVLKMLAGVVRESGGTMLFIANNLGLVSAMCDRIGVLLQGRLVETGTVDEVVGTALHPYTRNLMRSIPAKGDAEVGAREASASPIEKGQQSGCAFYQRCQARMASCLTRPVLNSVGGTHEVACWQCTPQ